MIIVLHLLNDNRDRATGFYWSSECDVSLLVYMWLFINTHGLASVNIKYKSGCSRYNGQIFNNKKDWEWVLATMNITRKLTNAKL